MGWAVLPEREAKKQRNKAKKAVDAFFRAVVKDKIYDPKEKKARPVKNGDLDSYIRFRDFELAASTPANTGKQITLESQNPPLCPVGSCPIEARLFFGSFIIKSARE